MSMEDDTCFGLVEEACTDDLPEGDAYLAWTNLKNKFEPKTGATKVLLKQQFNNCRLEDASKDPDQWISTLERLRQ